MKSGQHAGASKPVDLLRASRLAMRGGSGWHSHPELQWVAAGAGIVALETEEARWFALPGQALVVASNVPHDLQWYGAPSVDTLYLPPKALPLAEGIVCVRSVVFPLLAAAVRDLLDDPPTAHAMTEDRFAHIHSIILHDMLRSNLRALSLANPISRNLRTFCLRLRERPSTPSDLDTCAEATGMSRRAFTRRFHQETGETFNRWMRRLRALHACRKKLEGASHKDICIDCGYNNSRYMQADLREILGISLKNLADLAEILATHPSSEYLKWSGMLKS